MNTHPGIEHPLIESKSGGTCGGFGGWRSQFSFPGGRAGRVVGSLMAWKNAGMNRFAVETLDPGPEDQSLEIGFGPGAAIGMIAVMSPRGHVCGIETSDTMVRAASERNRELIRAGRVELSLSSISDIPYEYARFTRVLAVNNFQFWPEPERNLHEIQRVMRPGGRLVICLRSNRSGRILRSVSGFTEDQIREIAGLVRWTGYSDVSVIRRKSGYVSVVATR